MSEQQKMIEKAVEKRTDIIEEKLRNSFQSIKWDYVAIRRTLNNLEKGTHEFLDEKKKIRDIEKYLKELDSALNKSLEKAKENLSEEFKKFQEKILEDLSKQEKQVKELKKQINEKDLLANLKKENSKQIKEISYIENKKTKEYTNSLEKKNSEKIEKLIKKNQKALDNNKLDVKMFKHDFSGLREDLENWKKRIAEEVKEELDNKEDLFKIYIKDFKNQINSLKARNTILTKELNSLKGNGSKQLIKEIKTEEKKSNKKKTKKKGFIDSIVDKLSD